MNLTNIAEHRIKLLFKKSEGRATESDLKHIDRLENMMQKIEVDSVTLEENKSVMSKALIVFQVLVVTAIWSVILVTI